MHIYTLKYKPMKSAQILLLFLAITAFSAFAQDDVPKGVLTTSETVELIGGHIISFGSAPKDVLQIEQIGNNNQLTAIQQLTQTVAMFFRLCRMVMIMWAIHTNRVLITN
jgi:hypothetical protein